MSRNRILAIFAIAALLPFAPQALNAQNGLQFTSGNVTLTLDSTLVDALALSNIGVTQALPATFNGTTATLPIASGGVDTDTLQGVVYTGGGLIFNSVANSTTVVISQMAIISQANQKPALYALVTVNGKVQGMVAAFNLGGNSTDTTSGASFGLNNVALTLSAQGAKMLNANFGTSDFAAGQAVGTANITGTISTWASTSSAIVAK